MLKIDRKKQTLSRLGNQSLGKADITERYDLQEFISNSPQEFFGELGEDLFLIGKEIEPSTRVQDRIDLLALDREGQAVIIELKRGNHKLQLMQAIAYAAMIADWTAEDFRALLSDQQLESLECFLSVQLDDVNQTQRVILVAEGFDFSLLAAAEWLTERHQVDIHCYRIGLATDSETTAEYLVCSRVYPTPELGDEAVERGRRRVEDGTSRWNSWEQALSNVSNRDLVAFFQNELTAGREPYLLKRMLLYRVNGKRRWFMAARNRNAYVWQYGRFDDDVRFWQGRFADPTGVKPVKRGVCLRLFLETASDFHAFSVAFSGPLQEVVWQESPEPEERSPDDSELET